MDDWYFIDAELIPISETYEGLEYKTGDLGGWCKNPAGDYFFTIQDYYPKSYSYLNSDGSIYKLENECAVCISPHQEYFYEISKEHLKKEKGRLVRGIDFDSHDTHLYYVFDDDYGLVVKAIEKKIKEDVDDFEITHIARKISIPGERDLSLDVAMKGRYLKKDPSVRRQIKLAKLDEDKRNWKELWQYLPSRLRSKLWHQEEMRLQEETEALLQRLAHNEALLKYQEARRLQQERDALAQSLESSTHYVSGSPPKCVKREPNADSDDIATIPKAEPATHVGLPLAVEVES